MITEDYVSSETAKLLKEKGFKEWCFHCYGVAVLHNGVDISFDEECDLKNEGRENEIEYVEGGRLYDYGCNNRDKYAKVWAAPTLWVAMKWLREVHKLYCDIRVGDGDFVVDIISLKDGEFGCEVVEPESCVYLTYEQACEAAIKYCLEILI